MEKRGRSVGIFKHECSLILRLKQGNDQSAAISDRKLAINTVDVLLYGSLANAKFTRDLFIRQPVAYQGRNLPFATTESTEPLCTYRRVQMCHFVRRLP